MTMTSFCVWIVVLAGAVGIIIALWAGIVAGFAWADHCRQKKRDAGVIRAVRIELMQMDQWCAENSTVRACCYRVMGLLDKHEEGKRPAHGFIEGISDFRERVRKMSSTKETPR